MKHHVEGECFKPVTGKIYWKGWFADIGIKTFTNPKLDNVVWLLVHDNRFSYAIKCNNKGKAINEFLDQYLNSWDEIS